MLLHQCIAMLLGTHQHSHASLSFLARMSCPPLISVWPIRFPRQYQSVQSSSQLAGVAPPLFSLTSLPIIEPLFHREGSTLAKSARQPAVALFSQRRSPTLPLCASVSEQRWGHLGAIGWSPLPSSVKAIPEDCGIQLHIVGITNTHTSPAMHRTSSLQRTTQVDMSLLHYTCSV